MSTYIFSSESVGEGHPDKVADTISDAILDACLTIDPKSRVACETFVKSNVVVVGGEITIPKIGNKPIGSVINIEKVIRDAVRGIGYVNGDDVFHADQLFINNYLTTQSPDIAQGVDAKKAHGKKHAEQGAGDQGIMFGYACNETPELMPAPIMFAHRLGRELTRVRKLGKVKWLRPDAKSQVSVEYVDGVPTRIVNVVISTQHAADVEHAEIEKFCIEQIIKKVLPKNMLTKDTEYLINPTGKFVVGGSSSRPTAAPVATVVVPSLARTRPRLTAPPPTWAAGSRKMLSLPDSPLVAKCSSPTPSATHCLLACMSIPSAPAPQAMRRSLAASSRFSPSSPPTSSSNSTCSARSIRSPPTTVTSARTTLTLPGNPPPRRPLSKRQSADSIF